MCAALSRAGRLEMPSMTDSSPAELPMHLNVAAGRSGAHRRSAASGPLPRLLLQGLALPEPEAELPGCRTRSRLCAARCDEGRRRVADAVGDVCPD
eukprot:1964158-Heterocapsa_arctica.AAC.1